MLNEKILNELNSLDREELLERCISLYERDKKFTTKFTLLGAMFAMNSVIDSKDLEENFDERTVAGARNAWNSIKEFLSEIEPKEKD